MPGDAHKSTGDRRSRVAHARAENGFSLMEVIIVMILVAIALLAAMHSLTSVKRGGHDTQYATAASTIWRGIGAWRLDSKGTLPTIDEIGDGGAKFANLAGARYVNTWPEDPVTREPLELVRPTDPSRAPTTSTENTIQYASTGTTAWLAAYGHDGRILFHRSVRAGTSPEAPVG